MAASHRGRNLTHKAKFLALLADPSEAEWLEVTAKTTDLAAPEFVGNPRDLPTGLHFVRIGNDAAQIRVKPNGSRSVL